MDNDRTITRCACDYIDSSQFVSMVFEIVKKKNKNTIIHSSPACVSLSYYYCTSERIMPNILLNLHSALCQAPYDPEAFRFGFLIDSMVSNADYNDRSTAGTYACMFPCGAEQKKKSFSIIKSLDGRTCVRVFDVEIRAGKSTLFRRGSVCGNKNTMRTKTHRI